MRRRDFIKAAAASTVAWPIATGAQQPKKIARIGVLWHAGSAEEEAVYLKPLVESIANLGYVEGQNVIY